MRNLIVLGSGRSGTSAAAGLFRHVPSIFYGYDVLAPTVSNARGYYEDEVVNALNNILLRQMTGTALLDLVPERLLPWVGRRFSWMHRDMRSLWIAQPRRRLRWRMGYEIGHLIGKICSHQPFCLKDPRFSFTLPLWRPYMPDGVRFLVVVRDPADTVASMVRDAKELYERPLALTEEWGFGHWLMAQRSILDMRKAAASPDEWMVVMFEDILNGAALPAIEAFAGTPVDRDGIDTGMVRASGRKSRRPETDGCYELYETMRVMADEDLARWGTGPASSNKLH